MKARKQERLYRIIEEEEEREKMMGNGEFRREMIEKVCVMNNFMVAATLTL